MKSVIDSRVATIKRRHQTTPNVCFHPQPRSIIHNNISKLPTDLLEETLSSSLQNAVLHHPSSCFPRRRRLRHAQRASRGTQRRAGGPRQLWTDPARLRRRLGQRPDQLPLQRTGRDLRSMDLPRWSPQRRKFFPKTCLVSWIPPPIHPPEERKKGGQG